MCGITGVFNAKGDVSVSSDALKEMVASIAYRGPDAAEIISGDQYSLGFCRLSIIDLMSGMQPFYSEDNSIILICNGEIFNYKSLRKELIDDGFKFSSNCDVEVILHLYRKYGISLLDHLNGQFAFSLLDRNSGKLYLARDHFGICPLFYHQSDDHLVFASEIKAILASGLVDRKVNMTALDQVFSFPGMVSPETMFEGIKSLPAGHYLEYGKGGLSINEYWDLNYPEKGSSQKVLREEEYAEQIDQLLRDSVKLRLNADVPVGLYLSGGLDSSIIGSMATEFTGEQLDSFSIIFPDDHLQRINEESFQKMMAGRLKTRHHEVAFDWQEIERELRNVIYHAEAPLKETYNTCSIALSRRVNEKGLKVVLSGEGADEFFGGYPGYRFDILRSQMEKSFDLEAILEDEAREKLWGDPDFFYEKDQYAFQETRQAIYSDQVNASFYDFNALDTLQLDRSKIRNRDSFHQRSYIDFRLRLADHLISDHCDRVAYANSVEGRYPFLDKNLIEYVAQIPADIKLKDLTEKYILKKVAAKYVPEEIINRQKFGFVAPGSPELLQNNVEWVNDLLSYDQVRRQGYFNPDTVELLRKRYSEKGFKLNLPYESDLLIVVLTFNIFLETFKMPIY